MKPKLTKDLEIDLGGYHPGKDCLCGAWGEIECSCPGADWTDREVYRLRFALRIVEERLRNCDAYHYAMDWGSEIGLGQWIKRVLRKPRRRKAS
jgi:hypothetical protein